MEQRNLIAPTISSRSLFFSPLPYFCGWYYRCQSDSQTLALIPSLHRTRDSRFCAIQLITDTHAFHVHFPFEDFQQSDDHILIGSNRFGLSCISLDIHTPALRATGIVRFGPITPIRYDIMGPFQFMPFMQCRHSVFSMRHSVEGELIVNGVPYIFCNGVGYLEGDRGRSFPEKYAWTQCSFPDGMVMLSVADIPAGCFHFTGIIGIVLLHGKEYRLATYLGAKAVKIQNGEIVVRQGSFCLRVEQEDLPGHPLQAPVGGIMSRTVHEHPACRVYYRFSDGNTILLERNATNAAFEFEY